MGSIVELNDTLQITREEGFPAELDYEAHLKQPIKLEQVKDRVFEFKNKPKIRFYQQLPIRNFLVENRSGKWIYWGLIHMLEVTHDYVKQTTSGKFKIIHLYSPDEMQKAHGMIDTRPEVKP